MSDLISRKDAIEALCQAGCGSGHCGISCDDVKAIEQLPSAQPVMKWIPVTERLPEKSGHYLITVVSDVTDGEPTVFTDDYFSYGWDDWEEDVVAWAIKPAPWRGEEQ